MEGGGVGLLFVLGAMGGRGRLFVLGLLSCGGGHHYNLAS